MSKTVTIGQNEHELPQQGENPAWGEDLSDIIEDLIDNINNIAGPYDILETSNTILNTAGEKDVTGAYFDPTKVREFVFTYTVSRTTTKAISDVTDLGGGFVQVTSDEHSLQTGDAIVISGSGVIDGAKTVTEIVSTTEFKVAGSGSSSAGSFDAELVESGEIEGNHGQQGWTLVHSVNGDAKILLDINVDGFFKYTPTVLGGTAHSGIIKYIAKSLAK